MGLGRIKRQRLQTDSCGRRVDKVQTLCMYICIQSGDYSRATDFHAGDAHLGRYVRRDRAQNRLEPITSIHLVASVLRAMIIVDVR